jgi:hypothetical protein
MVQSVSVGVVAAEIGSDSVSITDVPVRGAAEEQGTAQNPVAFQCAELWLGRFGFFEYPKAGVIIGKFYWHREPVDEPFDRLEHAGTVSVVNTGGRWITPLRAMKIAGKPWATLNRVSEEELDQLTGARFLDFVSGLGDVEVGRYGDFVPNAGKTVVNGLGIAVPAGKIAPLVGMIAVTRPIALVKRFGATE